MRIGLRLTIGFLVIGVLVAGVGYFTVSTNRLIQAHMEKLGRGSIVELSDSHQMALALNACHMAAYQLVATRGVYGRGEPGDDRDSTAGAPADVKRTQQVILANRTILDRCLGRSRLAAESLSDWAVQHGDLELAAAQKAKIESILDGLRDRFAAHGDLLDQFVKMTGKDLDAATVFLSTRIQKHSDEELLPLIERYKQGAVRDFTGDIRAVERAIDHANSRSSLAATATLLIAVLLGFFISRSIAKPLAKLQKATAQLGKGHLQTRIPVNSRDEVGALAHTFNQMATELQLTTVSRTYVDNILQSMSEMLIVTDAQGLIRKVNRAASEQLGLSEEELLQRPLRALFAADDPDVTMDAWLRGLMGTREYNLPAKDGGTIPVYCSVAELRDDEGSFQGVICAALNIVERKRADQELRASLAEKEILLKEVHHRVKNNLQVISSLLKLQADESDDPQTVRMFNDSRGRIRSMALIHEQLYQAEDAGQVEFAEYIQQLTSHLIRSSTRQDRLVKLSTDVEPVMLPLNLAIPCGMIMNELVSNALQHGFPDDQEGKISVSFRAQGGQYRLTVEDNGVGLPAGAPEEAQGSLGLKVVGALAKQLHGELQMENGDGTRFSLTFSAETECE